jgi:small subunit ribosomal protein S15
MLKGTKKQRIIKEAAIHDKDTGSPEVQVSILTKKIDELTKHLKKNKKDFHSRRGLLQMVADRQSQMRYLQTHHPKRHLALIKKLDLRK